MQRCRQKNKHKYLPFLSSVKNACIACFIFSVFVSKFLENSLVKSFAIKNYKRFKSYIYNTLLTG